MPLQHEGPGRQPFAAVVSLRDRLTVAGTEELVRKVLAKEAPGAMLPGDWPEPRRCWQHFGPPASWIVLDRATGRPVLETYSMRALEDIDETRYEAVPVLRYLQGLNKH